MAKSPWQEWKEKNAARQQTGEVRPWDFLNPDTEYATDAVAEARMKICEGCEHFMATKQCSECGCFMPAKTKLLHAQCPIRKW